ncbi:cell division protein FtsZ [Sphingomicrobium lutaoense]|uniref:Cell division protein FtsZ n=1 Tax=Sphingomicrobium lutaoense TaxID=515949 RepID=A0A839Z0Z3_9SPHN|nr:cell division protein FtsZ [Sphingomicrobium lutaoense]MBB3764350.1 cell division protein FtsZ [Sphingomicrobium lutaoense]
MSIDLMRPEVDELRPRISVIGVGGAGGNAVANMIRADVQGVEFLVANTDAQALNASDADTRIQLGLKITQGLGAGSRPEIGRAAAEETLEEIEAALEGAHMCFIAAGMGGGTGTGAAPVIAKTARNKGILTVGVVTKPFAFEGARRMRSADSGIEELQQHVDTLIVIPNQNLFRLANADTTFKEAFEMADEVLQQGVRGITDLMVMPGLINLDFADVRSVMGEMGKAMMGTGEAEGDNRAIEAAEKAISNPLLDGVSMKGAKGVIISITGGMDMKLMEVDEAASHIKELVDDDANIIWGSAFNDSLDGKIRVSVVATGIDGEEGVMPAGGTTQASGQAGKVFTFPSAKPATPTSAAPVTETPAPTAPTVQQDDEGSDEGDDLLDLTAEDEAGDELLLDNEEVLTTPVTKPPFVPSDNDDVVTSEGSAERDEGGKDADTGKAAGGTLFERMSNIARGSGAGESGSGEGPSLRREPLDIPRFLNRQNNQ